MERYKIPDDILNRIPPYFYAAFAGELCSVFGPEIFEKPEANGGQPLFSCYEATAGWHFAFRSTTDKLGIPWLYQYYDALDWWDSDQFDSEIGDLLAEKFAILPGCLTEYYLYLRNKYK